MGNKFTEFNAGAAAGPVAPPLAPVDPNPGAEARQAGQAIAAFGDKIVAAQKRTRDRDDTINRSISESEFSEAASAEALRIETEEDFTKPELTGKYGAFLQENMQKQLENHTGSPESYARLAQRLNRIRSSMASRVASKVTMAGRARLRDDLNNRIVGIADETAQTGDIADGLARVNEEVEEKSPGLTQNEIIAQKQSGQALVYTRVFNDRLETDDINGARKILTVPGIAEILGSKEHRRMRREVLKIDRAAQKGQVEGEQTLAKMSIISGRPVSSFTPEERNRAAGLVPPQGRKTLQDEVNEFTTVFKRPPNEDELSKMAGTFISDPAVFGKGRTGLALSRMTDDASAFAQGALSPEDENRFRAAVHDYTQKVTAPNPDTGVLETRRATLPPFVAEAFAQRGEQPPSGAPNAKEEVERPLAEDAPVPTNTVFGDADIVTGPGAVTSDIAGRVPIVGDVFRPDQVEQATSRVRLLTRDLVRVLQSNPKFNEGERVSIEKDIDLSPKFMDTKHAFRNRVIGIDDALAIRQNAAENLIKNPITGKAERIQAMREFNAIQRFRIHLGAPPVVKTPEEAKKLPEGTLFRTPQGQLLRNRVVDNEDE